MIEEISYELQGRGVRTDIAREITGFASDLCDRDQTVLLLLLREKNQTSIANITGIPQQTVSWVVSERLNKLAEILVKMNAQAQYSNRGGR